MKRYNRLYTFLLVGFTILGSLAVLAAPSRASAQGQEVKITLKEYMISPDKITVHEGEAVQFTVTNAGTEEHNFVVEMESKHIEQKLFATNLMPGETRTAEFTFTVAGEWYMYCPVDSHKMHGMKGDIEVMSMGAMSPGMPATGSPLPVLPLGVVVLGMALLYGGLVSRQRAHTRRK